MDPENQILIPPSFDALYRDARGRLTLPADDFRARYELCEDMAQLLVERCQAVHHDQGVAEDLVLTRMQAGLADAASGFSADEAAWVTTRLAELLGWPWPGLAANTAATAADDRPAARADGRRDPGRG